MKSLCVALALALALSAAAAAQAPAPEDRSVVVDEVVVTARGAGPAMWRVRMGEGEVIILGSVTPLPHQPPWDTRRLDSHLAGARQVFLPPRGRPSALEAGQILLTSGSLRLPRGQSLAETLPTDLRARYLETASLFGLDRSRYDKWKPAAAGFLMLSDFREKAGLSSAKPSSTIARLAKDRGVPVQYVGGGVAMALYNGARRLTPAEQARCLAVALDTIDREADYARPIADAWAKGDLEAVRGDYGGLALEACLGQMSSYRQVVDRGVAEATRLLTEALAEPGKTVAVIDLNFLLRRNGVLDRLTAAGAVVTDPGA